MFVLYSQQLFLNQLNLINPAYTLSNFEALINGLSAFNFSLAAFEKSKSQVCSSGSRCNLQKV